MSNRPDAIWTPLDAAATRLGISPDATRKRLERGTLRGEKRGGRWHVLLDNVDAISGQNGRHPSGQLDATQDAVLTLPDATSDMARELIDQLKSENEYLRAQLAERSRELATERERSDVLQQLALSRIPAVGAGDPFSVAQEPADDVYEPDMPDDPPSTANGAAQTASRNPDQISEEVTDLARQLIEELGMAPAAARLAAAQELGLAG